MPPEESRPTPSPAQFVRTFASDAAALKSGAAPSFEEKAAPVQPPAPATPAPATPIDLEAMSKDGPIEQLPSLASTAPLPAPPSITPIHTYKSDFAGEVKERNASQSAIIAAELDARPVTTIPSSRGIDWMVVLAFFLIFIGIGAAGAAYYWRTQHPLTAPVATQAATPIFVDERQELSGTGSTLMQAIAQSVATAPAANAVRLLYTADSTSTALFNELALPAPDLLLRNITATGSMAGVINTPSGASPFFILAVTSYTDTFSGMLVFEQTMAENLAPLYPPYWESSSATSTPASASSTPATPAAPAFKDETILNHQVRALVDAQGRTILLYGYFNQTTLLIARDEAAFASILDRLTNSRTQS